MMPWLSNLQAGSKLKMSSLGLCKCKLEPGASNQLVSHIRSNIMPTRQPVISIHLWLVKAMLLHMLPSWKPSNNHHEVQVLVRSQPYRWDKILHQSSRRSTLAPQPSLGIRLRNPREQGKGERIHGMAKAPLTPFKLSDPELVDLLHDSPFCRKLQTKSPCGHGVYRSNPWP